MLAVGLALFSVPEPALAQAERSFTLTDQHGRQVSDTDLKGTPYAIFFGFTHCPEVCPTALYEISLVLEELGPAANRLKVLFVTVDPERDTAEQLTTYLQSFDPRIHALRGSPKETAAAAAAFKVTYRRVPQESGDYTMEHTALVFLIGADGKLAGAVDYRASHEEQVAKFRRLLAGD